MASELGVNLSMEWQRAQFACANALPAATFGAAWHGTAIANAPMKTAGTIRALARFMKLAIMVHA
jgi:hypothetical protein